MVKIEIDIKDCAMASIEREFDLAPPYYLGM